MNRWSWSRVAAPVVIAAAFVVVLSAAPASAHHTGDVDCGRFQYQEDAQAWMNAHPGDPDRLDGSDRDGLACESLPHRPVAPPPPVNPCASSNWVQGAIRDRYMSLNGPCGFLGAPLTVELSTPNRPGRYNLFQGGSIYWSPGTGAWAVAGAIRDRWGRLGFESGPLGFPVTNERRTPTKPGAYNIFQGGAIYWSPGTGAHGIRGAIRQTWGQLGWENGFLGFPTTDELRTPRKPGAYEHFQGGSIYWSPQTGAREIHGQMRDKWASVGWENGRLGFPTTNAKATAVSGGAFQHFQGGSLYKNPTGGTFAIWGAIRTRWSELGWERSSLGFPTSDEYAFDGGRRTDFQFGYIAWTRATGAVVHHTNGDLTGTTTAGTLLDDLAAAPESTGSAYDRALFEHWIDADADSCDTRAEVLMAESQVPVTVGAGCLVQSGQWFSYYDGVTWSAASDVDIDHVVSLKEAWDSGAANWPADRRRAFANDLDYDWTLQAVTDSVNAGKSDSDPAEWLPSVVFERCNYATRWVAIKHRWQLTVDDAERDALSSILIGSCASTAVPVPPRAT